MIEQLNYRFTSRKRLLERVARDQAPIPSPEDIRLSNSLTVDRMLKELELTEASNMGDLREAVRKLADV